MRSVPSVAPRANRFSRRGCTAAAFVMFQSLTGRLQTAQGYLYPHDFPEGWAPQDYLPEGEWQLPYYEPTERGYEARIRDFLQKLAQLRDRSG